MSHRKEIVPIFARCFRLLVKLSAAVDDGFFANLLNQESEKLLHSYIIFLKHEGAMGGNGRVAQADILQHQDIAKCHGIVQHDSRVAQYRKTLIEQIKNLLKLVSILHHLRLAGRMTPLLLERDLLLLELALLDKLVHQGPTLDFQGRALVLPPDILSDHLGHVHKQIAQFVGSREQVQNVEVFAKFSGIARRTLKRKLSELVEAGIIKRSAVGKKVFYSAPANL